MVEFTAGQTVRVYASVWDFCGSIDQMLYIKEVVFGVIPALNPARCLDISGIGILFDLECPGCTPAKVYSTWGSAYTDAQGLAYIDHIITEGDLTSYQDASAAGRLVQVRARITESRGQNYIIASKYSPVITVLPGLAPTHYISLSMGFVPPELAAYFETYISAISDNLMTYLAPLPSPWVYLKTTYDRVTNSFRLWLYLPATAVLYMAPGAVDDILNWLSIWVPLILAGIFAILAVFVGLAGLWILVVIFSAAAIISYALHDATVKRILAETKATNLTIQITQNNKEDAARSSVEDIWNTSAQTQADCTARLQGHRDARLAKLNGFLDQYAKYPLLVTDLTKIKDSFIIYANNILTEFKTAPYIGATACDTYFARLNSEMGTSNVATNEALGRNINPAENYSIACKGWTNQAACEKGGCYWYDAACHQEEECWIPNPLGGCILSANTGKTIVGVTIGLAVLGISYWLLTRKRAEVTSIYIGAREAAAAEAARTKAAYKEITAPAVPPKPPITPYPAVSTRVMTAPVLLPTPRPPYYKSNIPKVIY